MTTSRVPLQLDTLPEELLRLIVSYLPTPALKTAARTCRCLHRHATDLLWQSVSLEDGSHAPEDCESEDLNHYDLHDDTPLIRKLSLLAMDPVLAAKVHVLTHRCHMPTPNIFTEIPRMYFNSDTLSRDARLHNLARLAIRNMVNVHTLRIIYGHKQLSHILLHGFLDPARPHRIPLRKLWLESCSLMGIGPPMASTTFPTGLESIRFRRMRAETSDAPDRNKMRLFEFRPARGGLSVPLHDGAGGWRWTIIDISMEDFEEANVPHIVTGDHLREKLDRFDEAIWSQLPGIRHYATTEGSEPCPPRSIATDPMLWLIEGSAATLTNLTLDWILWRQRETSDSGPALPSLEALARLRFPHLRAFQLRNAVVSETRLPDQLFLLEGPFLDFLDAHPKIQCLAWPLDRFFSHTRSSVDVQMRARRLVAHLSMILTDLRIDSYYAGNGETLTDESREVRGQQERIRRRRFIEEFAPAMTKIEHIKLEGGIPRDEKREILRALRSSPLKKIVMIGVSFPIGNFWGAHGCVLKSLDPSQSSDPIYNLEEEEVVAVPESFKPLPRDMDFSPCYDWAPSPPFLHTIALHHADTVEELKLCGYNGSPILSHQTPMSDHLLQPLEHFHNLRQLVVSFWLLTHYDNEYRDESIIQAWKETRSPSATALIVVTPPSSPTPPSPVDPTTMPLPLFTPHAPPSRPQEYNRWGVELKTRFMPSALAYRVVQHIAPYLSPVAKERGVRVRASFCLGTKMERRSANDIFDLDIVVAGDDQLVEFVGPREEAERGRWWQKLEGRRWF